MTDEHPDADAGDETQDLYTERTVAEAPATGDPRVDDAIAGLSRLPGSPAEEHVAVLEEVHGRLRDVLGELDEDAGPPDMTKGRP